MDSKEFGLVAVQQLFKIESLHYGFWENIDSISINELINAQEKYISFLCEHIKEAIGDNSTTKILDAGCGTGIVTERLLQMGYNVDGLVPSNWMAKMAQKKIIPYKNDKQTNIYESKFEDFTNSNPTNKYEVVFFSESYQYIDLQSSFDVLNQILSNTGTVIIFDFFRRDGVKGKSPLGGGHSISKFYEAVEKNGFRISKDLDVTSNLSPNLQLENEILTDRVLPFIETLDKFLSTRYKYTSKLLKFLFRKKLDKFKYKYSSKRNRESFEKFKTYRLLVLEKS
jgi:SAM-dependent methyltransferase